MTCIKDIHEDKNIASEHPALAQRLISYMEEAHTPTRTGKLPNGTEIISIWRASKPRLSYRV